MFGPINWNRTFEYFLVASFYVMSVLMTLATGSELLFGTGYGAMFGLSAFASGISGWYLLKRFGDGIFIGER